VKLWLENLDLRGAAPPANIQEFYDVEFSLSVRGTGVFLHQRKQKPCENAERFDRAKFPVARIHLHTAFMDTKLRSVGELFSHFLLAFRVAQHRVRDGFLFDHQYPERTIYSESMEVRVKLAAPGSSAAPTVQYRWLSETTDPDDPQSWRSTDLNDSGVFRFAFRQADTLAGELCIKPEPWPDANIDATNVDAARV